MRRSWAAVTVGALALVVAAISYLVFRYTNEGFGWGKGYVVYALFNNAQGITQKSAVRSAGIDIGQVEDKTYDPETKKAKVAIRLDPKIRLYENASVQKRAASLLGEIYLEIDPGTPFEAKKKQEVLEEGDYIENVFESTEISEIMDQVGTTLPILKEILKDVRELTSGPVKDIAENTNRLIERNSEVLETTLHRIDNIAANVESITRSETDDIKITIQNLREITEGLKSLVGTSEGEVTATGKEIRGSAQQLKQSISSLEKSLDNIEKITSRVEQGQGTIGKLVSDEGLGNNLEEVTEDVGDFVRGLTRVQAIVGLRTEYNYLASTFKNYVSLTLAPRPDKFYLIEIVDDPRGYRETTSTTTNSSATGPRTEIEIKTSDKLRFSFMFGKRGLLGVPWLTGRFGIKESTGGLGLDFSFLNDRLVLSADLFDARSNEYPRLQGRASLAVYKKNLYLLAGVDDVLNQERALGGTGAFFDWFFGAQLIFRDDDLRSLLLLGGGAAGAAAGR